MFEPGQFVQCIEDKYGGTHFLHRDTMLDKGEIYTVSKTIVNKNGSSFIILEEVKNHLSEDGSWDPRRFQLVDDSKIDIFRKMLTPDFN